MPTRPTRWLMLAAACLAAGSAAAGGSGWRWSDLPQGAAAPAVPADNPMNEAKVELGRRLFYDADLSRDGTLACAGCHEQRRGFADGERTHIGVTGEPGLRNAIGLANVAWRTNLTWTDAKLTTLEAQAMVPMTGTHPIEMGFAGGDAELARRLASSPCYARLFATAVPRTDGRATIPRATAALAAFQRTLVSSDSPYDHYRAGDRAALSPQARAGGAAFAKAGCAACHGGADLTDSRLHYVGTGAARNGGYGLAPEAAVKEEETGEFRTPPLRNVAVTGPWLHDGSAATIEAAVRGHAAAAVIDIDMPALLAFLDAMTDRRFLSDARFARPGKTCPVV